METVLKGKLKIEITKNEMEAALVFSPSPSAAAWTKKKILALLSQELVLPAVDTALLDKAIAAFAEARKETRAVVAEGLAPESPCLTDIVWEDHPVPDELKDEVARKTAGLGTLTLSAWKPIAPGFGKNEKGHERTVRRERAAAGDPERQMKTVDVREAATGYVHAGAVLAALPEKKTGLPGKTVRGRIVYPSENDCPPLYLSGGIVFRENRLFAEKTGIFLRGKDWAALVPFMKVDVQVIANDRNTDCLFFYTPGTESDPAAVAHGILAEAERLGFRQDELLDEKEVEALLKEADRTGAPLHAHSLCRPVDSLIELVISQDRMSAVLSLRKERGAGKKLTLSEISSRIQAEKLKRMDTARVRGDILAFFHDPMRKELIDYTLATGVPPTKGEKGSVEWETTFDAPEKRKAALERLARIDDSALIPESISQFGLDAVDETAAVVVDQKILRLIPPERGTPGEDVSGRPVQGILGDEVRLTAYENVKKYGFFYVAAAEGVLECGTKGDVIRLRVRPQRDARVVCTISDDNMEARISIIPHEGSGDPVVPEMIRTALKDAGVALEPDREKIEEAVVRSRSGEKVSDFVVAWGKPPVHTEDQRFKLLLKKGEKRRVVIRPDGSADYKSATDISIIKKGDLVAEITPPSTARPVDGMDVRGKILPGRSKGETAIPELLNLREEKDPNGVVKLYAAIDGELFLVPGTVGVREVHVVPGDVGYATGNIQFPASVFVKGSVLSGFSVFSKADVTVKEYVEQAVVSADGSISVGQGVKGGGKAVLRAKGSVSCAFVEYATVLAVHDIAVAKFILHSAVKCNGKITVKKSKGTVLGGKLRAKCGMEVPNLGAPSGVKTEVSFGQDYLVGDAIEREERALEKIKKRLLDVEKEMAQFQRDIKGAAEQIVGLRQEKARLLKMIEKSNAYLFTLREKYELHFPSSVAVAGTVFPGVVIESHGRVHVVKEERRGVRFTFNEKTGAIEEKPYRAAKEGGAR